MINYYLLMKPGIIIGNLITFAAGFLLASRGELQVGLFIVTLLGLGLIMASGCVFNNYIDRFIDKKMDRTKDRPLASGKIGMRNAITFGVILGIAGYALLFAYTNWVTVSVATVGFVVYVCLYSFLKCQTSYSTLIGSIAGAVPPVVGYTAVSNQLDLGAIILFLLMVFWQMPHFFAIALWHLDDYTKAGVPVLPITKGALRAKVHMLLYIIFLIPIVAMLTVTGYTGYWFLTVTTVIGLLWLAIAIKGFSTDSDKLWGRQMFRVSLVMINVICILIAFDRIS